MEFEDGVEAAAKKQADREEQYAGVSRAIRNGIRDWKADLNNLGPAEAELRGNNVEIYHRFAGEIGAALARAKWDVEFVPAEDFGHDVQPGDAPALPARLRLTPRVPES